MPKFQVILRALVEATNLDQAVEATKCVADDEAVESIEVVDPELVENLQDFLPHLGIAIEAAKIDYPDATIKLGVLAAHPDGSGKVIAKFNLTFVEDLRKLVGDPV